MNTRRHTLKSRVNKVILFCILFTIVLFGGTIMYLTITFSKSEAVLLTKYMGFNISQEMNSDCFLENRHIKGLEAFDPKKPDCKEWLDHLKERQSFDVLCSSEEDQTTAKEEADAKLNDGKEETKEPGKDQETKTGESGKDGDELDKDKLEGMLFFDMTKMVSTYIELNNKIIYKSDNYFDNKKASDQGNSIISKGLIKFYSDVNTDYPLYDSSGKIVGKIATEVNIDYMKSVAFKLCLGIILIGLVSVLLTILVSRFMTSPIIKPLAQLNEKIRNLAGKENMDDLYKQVQLNNPLKEIKELADSTNLVIQKMKNYNDMLHEQTLELESQNDELEAQNEELIDSRKRIEEQRSILESQRDELEAQNSELIESKRQIEETQALLVQTENMALIGQLTAAISHEINTPLGAASSNAQMCDMMLSKLSENNVVLSDEELKETVNETKDVNSIVLTACQRANEIIRSLKSFTRFDQAEFQNANIVEGIKSVLTLTSNLWMRKITIHEDYDNISFIRCFPGLLNQVFMNILINAIQAIESTGDIYIKTYTRDTTMCISFRDTGCGIREEDLSKIFEPRFSTKKSDLGMGLGLSICQNIIKKHNGEIKVTSEVGKGTEFIVCIPMNNE